MIDKIVAILLSLLILGQAFAVRGVTGTWLFPSCLLGLFWFFMTLGPLVFLWSVPIEPYGTGFIFLSLCFFSASALLFPWRHAFHYRREQQDGVADSLGSPFLKRTFYLLSVVSFGCIVLSSLAQGISLHDLIFDLIMSAASYRELLFSGHFTSTIWERIGAVLVYSVAILGGLIVSSMPRKRERLGVMAMSFIPSTFMALAQSGKGALFCCIAFYYGGILTHRVLRRDFRLFNEGALKKLFVYATILFVVTVASLMSRGLQNSNDSEFIKKHIKFLLASYAFGHLYAFSDWCAFEVGRGSQINYEPEATSYGFYTFSPIFRSLGSTKNIPDGMYDDYYAYNQVLTTNIYTMFRGLIQDFGVAGTLVFMFFLGLAIHGAFYGLLQGRCPSFSAAIFIFAIGFIYTSYVRSLFDWSELYLTFALICSLLYWNRVSAGLLEFLGDRKGLFIASDRIRGTAN